MDRTISSVLPVVLLQRIRILLIGDTQSEQGNADQHEADGNDDLQHLGVLPDGPQDEYSTCFHQEGHQEHQRSVCPQTLRVPDDQLQDNLCAFRVGQIGPDFLQGSITEFHQTLHIERIEDKGSEHHHVEESNGTLHFPGCPQEEQTKQSGDEHPEDKQADLVDRPVSFNVFNNK